jgi:hypothetical protein
MSMSGRSRPIVPAHLNFLTHRDELARLPLAERFDRIAQTNLWGAQTRSGLGSELAATARLRAVLPSFLARHGVRSLLDVPCGDFGWLSTVDLGVSYIGADIVPSLVEENERRYGGPSGGRRFLTLDLTKDALPRADLVLCRDCLVHLSFENVGRALANIRASGAKYMLTTTFLEHDANTDIEDGDWRMLNLERAPFNLPSPIDVLVEDCWEGDGAYSDKALGLWIVSHP